LLVVDWDGTVTERDTQMMVLERFGDPEPLARAEEGLERGELTLHECIELEFSGLREPLDVVVPWLVEHARIRPGFHELAESHRPLILSTSFEQLIRPVLAREGLDDLELLCNAADPRPDGWRAIWRDESQCADCGEPCKRGSLPEGELVYVGDGWSDRCAALAADRVFARDGLARYLRERGVPFEPFEDFRDVAAAVEPRTRS
jgi:2-hydroxy-3-keto-5-methylthiopentenyl-1-phosphate phosphatase